MHHYRSIIVAALCLSSVGAVGGSGSYLGLQAEEAVAVAAQLPEWVRVRPVVEGAIIGIGQASGEQAREQSKALAVVEISEQMVVSISSSMESDSATETTVNNDEETVALRESLRRRIQSDTAAHFLPGVEIIAQETVGETVYTMAKLERQRFQEAVTKRTTAIDADLEPIARLGDELDISKLSMLQRAYALSLERSQLGALLATQGEALAPGPLPLSVIEKHLGRLVKGSTVRLEGTTDAPAARDSVLDIIDVLGLTVVQSDEAVFELRLRDRQRSRQVGDWTRVTITAAITAVDRSTGEVIGSLEHSVERSSVQGEGEAAARAREAMIEDFGKKLQNRLLLLLAGQGQR